MYHPDLQPYCIGDHIYPKLLSIGYLDFHHDFLQGDVDKALIDKLAYLTSLADENYLYNFEKAPATALIVHTGYVRRGLPYRCPFCKLEIHLQYGDVETILGYNHMNLLNTIADYVYVFPTLLHHYINEHQYVPPTEFLETLHNFDVTQPFNCLKLDKKYSKSLILPAEYPYL